MFLYKYGMVLTTCYDSSFLYILRALKLLYTHSVATLSLLHEVGSMLLHDSLAQSVKKFPPFMESKSLQEHTKDFFLIFTSLVKLNQSHYRPDVPRVFQEVKVLRFHDNDPGWW